MRKWSRHTSGITGEASGKYITEDGSLFNESKNSEQFNLAPLILIPVELERQKIRTRFNLRWSGAELFPNLSLEAKLDEQGVELPILGTPEDKTDIDVYFQAVTDAVAEQENWNVVPDIYLDFFSFTKFVMYKDLEPGRWSIDAHPLLGSILGNSTSPNAFGDSGFEPGEIDLKLRSRNLYHVMDADSSQIAVIEEIKNGKNLVVEGPPGTGKSQTIANAIAELLAVGKKVLFVSEKMAALEVVKSRLDSVGLGDFCLELHSHKSNKRAVLNELERTISAPPPRTVGTEGTFAQIDSLKTELNAYVNALHEPIGKTQKSPFVLFGVRETAQRHFESVKRDMLSIRFTNLTEYTSDDWIMAKQCLEGLVTVLPRVIPVANNPWRGCKPDIVTPPYLEDTKMLIGTCITTLDALERAIHNLADACAIHIPTMLETLPAALRGANVMKKGLPIEREVLLNEAWDHRSEQASILIGRVETLQEKLGGACDKFNINLLTRTAEASRDLEDTIHSLVDVCAVQPISTPKHFQSMLSAAGVMAKSIPVEREVLLNEAWNRPNPEAEKLVRQVETVQEALANVLTIFNPAALDRDISSLRDEYKDLCGIFPLSRFFNRKYRSIKLEIRGFYKEKPPQKIEQILASLEELGHCINMRKEIQALEQTGRSLFGSYWKAEESDPDQLRQFAEWIVSFRKELLNGTLTDTAVDLVSGGIENEHLKELITQVKTQYEDFVKERGIFLSQLEIDSKTVFGLEAENVSFAELSSRLEMWQTALPLFDSWLQFVHGDVSELPEKPEQLIADLVKLSQCTDLRKEIADLEQTGRALFGRYWRGEDSNLKRLREFKKWIVEFREQLIGGVLTEQAIDIVSIGVDQEQIEHLAKQIETAEPHFVEQRDALFNHLGTDANTLFSVETKKIPFVELRSRLELWEQELTHLQVWRAFVRQCEECQQTIAQPLLDSIAGDERDVIFLSIGYGKDASGRLHRNFGPLNHEGGQHRLNVLITRARERCVVFSNFRASDLQLNADAPVGAKALKVFLDYAENRNLRTDMSIGDDTDSPFEDAVREFLTSHGYTVNTQVGSAGYRIDLAVVNPAAPGRYLLGIECDGARYHSSRVARDRDRLRQQVLEGLGWTLHRVWSTDWYRNRAATGQRLLEAVECAKFTLPEEAPTVPEPDSISVLPEPESPPLPEPSSSIADYVVCADLGILVHGKLHTQSPSQLAKAISRIVEIESPVHIDEVMLRIRNLWGLGRAGSRIKNAIEKGALSAQRDKRIRRTGNFLWTVDERDIPIRRRKEPKIEWICNEEITEAMKLVITIQGAIPRDALIAESAKLFGYKSVRKVAGQRMKPILDKLIKAGPFQILSNGMVSLL